MRAEVWLPSLLREFMYNIQFYGPQLQKVVIRRRKTFTMGCDQFWVCFVYARRKRLK